MTKHKIMVVDDSRIAYAELKMMLEGSEMEIVGFCRSGEEAIERYEEIKPDLVTLDIVMPGMDGLETCGKIKEKWPDAKVYMVSSMAYDDMIDRAVAMGAEGFLFKPFTKENLLDSLRASFKKDEDESGDKAEEN